MNMKNRDFKSCLSARYITKCSKKLSAYRKEPFKHFTTNFLIVSMNDVLNSMAVLNLTCVVLVFYLSPRAVLSQNIGDKN